MTVGELRTRLREVTLRDERRLRRRLDRAASQRDAARRTEQLADVEKDVAAAEARAAARRASVPDLDFPPELPVTERRDDIAAAIADHQVVVVAGATGSGKTTQLPKILLGLGRGVRGTIAHTQPRRIAARSVAARIAEETRTTLGETVGYAVRFDDRSGPSTLVRVMTDGVLLAEIHDDPMLLRYDTIVVDEAHERSLTIDFLLGYLRRLLPRRPDLKVVITSATIDPERFAAHFAAPDGSPAPIIEVSGRTYPVEVRYRPPSERADAGSGDVLAAIGDAVDELGRESDGDVLVFLSGEREIRDTADMLRERKLRRTEILPLYGRLSAAEQHKVFEPHTGRRIVLATNVAETSLTVPGIRYVVDPGTARISRYSQRLKVQRLPIEPISQASASQRAGRSGRTSDGICIRLYSEEDFASRPEFTDPEILRTNLASVLLQMASLDLGPVEDFPFLDPPDRRAVRDGVGLLEELGALSDGARGMRSSLTTVGRQVAAFPLDPRLARMLVAASSYGVLREMLVIVSALSIQDPRERPLEAQQQADTKHARFADPTSDFLAYLNLWNYLREQRRELSGNAFRRTVREEYLHYVRIREWQDVHAMLRDQCRGLGLDLGQSDGPPADPDRIHAAALAGLLSHIGLREGETRDYLGARNGRFAIFPGSGLAKKPPQWVVAAELVETSRLWARTVAKVEPAWIEREGAHLLKRTYSEPHWSRRRGAVMAHERVTLYGVPVVADRLVSYGPIDREVARELFIRHALVQGEWSTHHAFWTHNAEVIAEIEGLEDRVRRRDIRVDDETLFAFYDNRVGADVVSVRHFDTWWKKARRRTPDLLDLTPDDLVRDDAGDVALEAYPTTWESAGIDLPLSYAFEPESDVDGVTVDVPLERLADLDETAFLWGVPGYRQELVTALLRGLPKDVRRRLVPAPDVARRLLALPLDTTLPVAEAMSAGIRTLNGDVVAPGTFDLASLPRHLRVTFRVRDGEAEIARGKDLDALRAELRPRLGRTISAASSNLERTGIMAWDLGTIPTEVTSVSRGHEVTAYPALVDRGTHVDLRVFASARHAEIATRQGVRRLLALNVPSPAAQVSKDLGTRTLLVLAGSPYRSTSLLMADCVLAGIDAVTGRAVVRDAETFGLLREQVRSELYAQTSAVAREVERVISDLGSLRSELDEARRTKPEIVRDVEVQLSWLVFDGFVSETGLEQLRHVPRYLRAAAFRVQHATDRGEEENRHIVQDLEARFYEAVEALPDIERQSDAVAAARWALEELRVSLFAQRLRTAASVSPKRVTKLISALR
ncbi:ATP-dependent RNA helicase HrpA [Mumia sp. zg.B53]|uniref:ATP-dependent RNA helicase HrpA n=1 Tax=Mumia sp. zg.B53 TaxID=2855449 RepID=UPI001C6F51EA|nr:ATP-dependent RNA helicase HrpA [Mumia sp. zg.B53]MBW9213473.1 ATP-dependent RNA helicase HrpA [Mumia sp. zg.B53]